MPRLLVDPEFAAAAIVPLSQFSDDITFVQGKLTAFDGKVGTVETSEGEVTLTSDISVLATGSRYANSVTRAQSGSARDRIAEFKRHNANLQSAKRVLIVGGGPIGVELAGEITQDYPAISVTVVEASDSLLTGTSRTVAAHAQKVLEARGVSFIKGEKVTVPAYGEEPVGGTATTDMGRELPFDMIFWAVGSRANTAFMDPAFLNERGQIKVDDHLQVKGMSGVYALGDVTDVKEVKKAIYVGNQVPVVAKNIIRHVKNRSPRAVYKPKTVDEMMFVTLGRSGGVGHMPGLGMMKANWLIRMFKAKDMLTSMMRKATGAPKSGRALG
ncbi:FAD-dependent oxidoreductase [Marivita sp.]|uniref:NAD(P)/FAD-dependent oxidoreductase n=1 Tax=Marivita sp. TaxID=2003365 RepID=UPI00321B516A